MLRISGSLLIGAFLIAGPATTQTAAGDETRIPIYEDLNFDSHCQTQQRSSGFEVQSRTQAPVNQDISGSRKPNRWCEDRLFGESRPGDSSLNGRSLNLFANSTTVGVSAEMFPKPDAFQSPTVCCRLAPRALSQSSQAIRRTTRLDPICLVQRNSGEDCP